MSTTTETPLAWYHYPAQYQQFISEVDEHEMAILHEDGLYRHLRFARPGTSIWSFNLITWPGYLTIVGDIGGGHTFHRVPDMLDFFDVGQPDGHINVGYWSEKLEAGQRSVQGYSEDAFRSHVDTLVTEWAENLSAPDAARLRERVTEEILEVAYDEHEALSALGDFTFGDRGDRLDEEMDEAAWRGYDHHFLIALHAILWGAKRYHASRRAVSA